MNFLSEISNQIPVNTWYYKHVGTSDYEAWYTQPCGNATVSTNASPGVLSLYASPICFPKTVTTDMLGVRVTGAAPAGKSLRFGVYTDSGNGIFYPNALVFDSGNIAADSTGNKTTSAVLTFPSGTLYWFAVFLEDVTTIGAINASSAMLLPIGLDSTALTQCNSYRITQGSFGALPSIFPAGADPKGATTKQIALYMRLSA